jgi:hypothetical protein
MKHLVWVVPTLFFVGSVILFTGSMYILATAPDPPKPVVVKVCNSGVPVFRRQDDSLWIRYRLYWYRIATPLEELCK